MKNLVITMVLISVVYTLVNQQITMHRIKNNISDAKAEVEKLNKENSKLEEDLEMSQSDAYIETIAREKGNLVKKDEIPVIEKK
ncbi:hypothetical protein CM240_2519 [Clostridium bornimense]|uniref:Cell division protein FtsL n=1 Tax=Clostridium bornimense TaxID=1216932 RepID=W6S194_9CLOT|nr:septum formation initiator family protein [Clostridium bornimense]CDM69644.1 hypothetical protein CM240_2519 [Clostridium bornimense]